MEERIGKIDSKFEEVKRITLKLREIEHTVKVFNKKKNRPD